MFMRCIALYILYILVITPCFSQNVWQSQYKSSRKILQGSVEEGQNKLFLTLPEEGIDSLDMKVVKMGTLRWQAQNETYGYDIVIEQHENGSLQTHWSHYREEYDLYMKAVDKVLPITFAQHPKPPFSYYSDSITFTSEVTGLQYGATLNIPKNMQEYPLAILITGTGRQDRNYVYSGHQFFTVLADALAQEGIASIRVDDRGVGQTTGDFSQATSGDFSDDVKAVIHYLKERDDIDHSYLGLIGHSEGGTIASMVTAQERDVKFMVSLSGVGVSGFEILMLQNRAILESHQMPDSLVTKYMSLYNDLFEVVYQSESEEDIESGLRTSLEAWTSKEDEATLKAMQLNEGRAESFLYRYGNMAKRPWYRFMIKYEPHDYLPLIKVPVLAVNGSKDIMVPARENLKNFSEEVNKKLITTKEYAGLNHMYQHCEECTAAEIKELDEVFAPQVLDDVSKWIIDQYQKRQ
ncbi:alpha/beta hydrolase [Fulvivirga maritima]|uniref:alpha/beta hydrolase n=1 Tax=Fulvivirga maritima TaxID=2904247 RepID=UPI001F37E5B7|nr:alpha/beta fold hydrolase [Fulvivirga maritima]UII25399.1 alpha/beta hydrolase [Fulvivirga maritima]